MTRKDRSCNISSSTFFARSFIPLLYSCFNAYFGCTYPFAGSLNHRSLFSISWISLSFPYYSQFLKMRSFVWDSWTLFLSLSFERFALHETWLAMFSFLSPALQDLPRSFQCFSSPALWYTHPGTALSLFILYPLFLLFASYSYSILVVSSLIITSAHLLWTLVRASHTLTHCSRCEPSSIIEYISSLFILRCRLQPSFLQSIN